MYVQKTSQQERSDYEHTTWGKAVCPQRASLPLTPNCQGVKNRHLYLRLCLSLSLPFSPTLPSSSSSLLTHPRHTANIYIPSANLLIDNVVQLKLLLTLFKSAKYPQFHQRAKSLPQVCWVSMDSEQRVVNKITQLIQALAKRGPLHPSPWEERPCCWDGNAQICCPSSSPCTALGGMWPVFASVTHSSKRCGVSLCYLLYMFLYTSIICLHIFSITYEPMKSDYNQDILIQK